MRKADRNSDGRANKFELFKAFKKGYINSTGGSSYNNSWNPNFHGGGGNGW
jgi:hypothetical protein